MFCSKQRSRISPEVNSKLAAKILFLFNYQTESIQSSTQAEVLFLMLDTFEIVSMKMLFLQHKGIWSAFETRYKLIL